MKSSSALSRGNGYVEGEAGQAGSANQKPSFPVFS